MTIWTDKNGRDITVGASVDLEGNRWEVARYGKNTVVLSRRRAWGAKFRRVETRAYPSSIEVVA